MRYLLLTLALFCLPSAASAATYATWNPADKYVSMTLSNGDLTATHGGANGQYNSVRSTIGKSSGKWYWEYVFSGGVRMSAIANTSAPLNNYIGSDANGFGYFQDGNKYTGGLGSAYGASYTNETIGVALDMDAGTLTFYKNNVSQGTAFTGLSGTYYAAISIDTTGTSITANFGASALTYSPPAGYCAGLVDTCPSAAASFNFWQFFDF